MFSIFISNFLILGMFTYLGASNFPYRYKGSNKQISIFLFIYMIINVINYKGASVLNGLILLFINFIYFFIQFKGTAIKKLFVLLPLPIIVIFSETLVANILNMIANIDSSIDINSAKYFIGAILSNFFAIIVLILYVSLSRLFKENKLPKYTWIIFILPISTYLLIINLNEYHYLVKKDFLLFISIMGMVASIFLFYYIFYKTINNFKKFEEVKSRENSLAMKFSLLDEQYSTNFRFLHDLLHKCKNLNIYIDQRNIDSAKKEISELYDITFKEFNSILSNSIILNTLIKEKLQIIIKEHIKVETIIEYNDFSFMKLNDQYDMFSILLNCAITACLESKQNKKYIYIRSRKKECNIIVQFTFTSDLVLLENNKLNEVLFLYNAVFSVKEIHETSKASIIIVFKTHHEN